MSCLPAASPGIHGPHPPPSLPQAPADPGVGGGGRLGKQHGWRLEATPGNALLVCFIVFSVGLLPHVACSLVQARPCEPSGMPAPPFLLVPLLLGCSPTGLHSGPFSQVAGGLTSLNLILETAGRESEQSKRYLPF